LNPASEQSIHLCGHLQELALAEVGAQLGQRDLVACAHASAEPLFLPDVASSFDFPRVLPFDVSCAIAGLAGVARAIRDEGQAHAAGRGQAWFHGRNTAAQPVYDARQGMVFEGIDNGTVSRNSGAESNIEGALALLGYG